VKILWHTSVPRNTGCTSLVYEIQVSALFQQDCAGAELALLFKHFKKNLVQSVIHHLCRQIISTLICKYYRSLTPNETTNAYAKFRGISFNSFRFKIVAANKEGHSKAVSEVYVPSRTESKYSFFFNLTI
jgi:hypothetical protein